MGYRIKGYVTIQAEGIFLERFLNICMRRELDIRNVRRLGAERLVCDLSIAGFRRIRPVCYRTKTRVKILKRQGLPFLIHRYRKRKFAVLGVILVMLLLWYTSGHIMGITVFGNEKIPTETVIQHLARSGVELGKSARNLSPSHIRNQMMRDLDELAWIGINVSGSRVYVEVVERLTPEPRVEMEKPCHLVACRDGVIVAIEAKDGQTLVKVGSGVRQGDVLVSGIMDNTVTGYRAVHAYGEVIARTTYRAEQEYPLSFVERIKTGKEKIRYRMRILNREVPLSFGKGNPYSLSEKNETEKEYRIPVDFLPSLFVVREQYQEQQEQKRTRTVEEVLTLAEKDLTAELKPEIPEKAQIEEREMTHTLTERGMVRVTLTVTCLENIATEIPVEREEESV